MGFQLSSIPICATEGVPSGDRIPTDRTWTLFSHHYYLDSNSQIYQPQSVILKLQVF
jgi:hypothetical protein